MPKRPNIPIILIIVITIILMFLPAIRYGFINWDDDRYILNNAAIQSISGQHIKQIFLTTDYGFWIPLTRLSWMFDYKLFKKNPTGYHGINILLHTINTVLVFFILSRLFKSKTTSRQTAWLIPTFLALLWGIHPMRVESVVWIAERKDVLCGFFFFLSTLSYLQYLDSPTPKSCWFTLATATGIGALMAKPMAVSLPLVWLLLARYKTQHPIKKLLLEIAPLGLFSALVCLITIHGNIQSHALVPLTHLSLLERALNGAHSFSQYCYKTMFPLHVSPLYLLKPPITIMEPKYSLSMLFLLGIASLSGYTIYKKKWRALAYCFSYSIITLIPISGAILQSGAQAAADRFFYIPSLGIIVLLGTMLQSGATLIKSASTKKAAQILAISGCCFYLIFLGLRTRHYMPVFQDSITFWHYILKQNEKTPVPLFYNNLGTAYLTAGDKMQAKNYFEMGLNKFPNHKQLQFNLKKTAPTTSKPSFQQVRKKPPC